MNIRTAHKKIQINFDRKFTRHSERLKKRTFKPGKYRRTDAQRKGKIIELSRYKNKQHHITSRGCETFFSSVLISALSCPGRKPSCKAEEKVFMAKNM